MPDPTDHFDWDERLQDWIDGDLGPSDVVTLEAHLAGCSACQARLEAFREVDAALANTLPPPALPQAFDRSVLERLDRTSRADGAARRARVEREWRAEMESFSGQWRAALRSTILNVLLAAGLVVALVTRFPGLAAISRRHGELGHVIQYFFTSPAATLVVMAIATSIVSLALMRAVGEDH